MRGPTSHTAFGLTGAVEVPRSMMRALGLTRFRFLHTLPDCLFRRWSPDSPSRQDADDPRRVARGGAFGD